MDRNDILDLASLRRAAPKASAFVVLASDGTVIATHGFIRGSITYAALPAGSSYDKPVMVKSSLGEEWHLLARKLKGGSVVVGASSTDCPPDINARLLETANGFGSSFESAILPSLRDKDENVDFALLTDEGILWADQGGIPLKAKKLGLWFKEDGPIVTVAGTPFFIRKVPIMDRAKHQVGSIVVLKEISLEQQMLHESLIFNIVVAVVSLLLCGGAAPGCLRGRMRRPPANAWGCDASREAQTAGKTTLVFGRSPRQNWHRVTAEKEYCCQ